MRLVTAPAETAPTMAAVLALARDLAPVAEAALALDLVRDLALVAEAALDLDLVPVRDLALVVEAALDLAPALDPDPVMMTALLPLSSLW